jgi:hypothetical protein
MRFKEMKPTIVAALDCAAICRHCAISCLKEEETDVKMMTHCIHLDLVCAALCDAAAELMSLGSNHSKEICQLCAEACDECAKECRKHDTEHCQMCADACEKCAKVCRKV